MTDLDLARRAVACKHWKWMPGMRLVCFDGDDAARICTIKGEGLVGVRRESGIMAAYDGEAWPDCTDPATVGCLLALVRAAWGDPYLTVDICGVEDHRVWACYSCDLIAHAYGDTEAAALVAALEAAP